MRGITIIRVLFIYLILLYVKLLNAQISHPELGEVFRDDVIPRVDIYLPPDSLAHILDWDNLDSNYPFHATFIFDNGAIRDTLEDVGFRLRGNTSRTAAKKSFKISFNTYAMGRKYKGLEKMNINGEHNDPTIFRSKLAWDIAGQMGLVGSRCNHVNFYINDEYYGVYANVEHIDEEFVEKRFGNKEGNLYKCLWPADLDYLGNNPQSYKLEVFGRQVYQLKTNLDEDDYSKLAAFIIILNNTPTNDLACELEQVFNVDNYLKYIVFDILTGNWDGPIYNKNNFYLYENPTSGLIEYIPFDLDNTFGIDWFEIDWPNRNIYNWSNTSEDRPIYERILEVPEYRNRYTYYMNQTLQEVFNENNLTPHIDSLKSKIDAWRMSDPLASGDYGYSFSDYEDSFTQSLSGHVKYGLKDYINTRNSAAANQLDLQNIEPIISQLTSNIPDASQDIAISAKVGGNNIITVQLHYQINNQGSIEIAEMFDDGSHGDGAANDGIFGTVIPPLVGGGVLNYFVKGMDNSGLENRNPKCVYRDLLVGTNDLPLYINEFMASNNSVIADAAGEFDDWIEIYNGGSEAIYLGDKFLSDNSDNPDKWAMPDVSIQPGEFLLFWADNDEAQGAFHTNFKLSSSGEFIGIFDGPDNNFAWIDGVAFDAIGGDEALSRLPNGTGAFQFSTPTPAGSNEPLGLDFFQKNINISVFPNPANERLHIVLEKEISDNWALEIIDNLGRVILEKNNLSGDTITIDLSEKKWSEGIYFIKIKFAEVGFWSGQFIKF